MPFQGIKEQLLLNEPLKQLARIPLLTAILCALHRQYKRSLPGDRVTLYEKCIETLLEGREKARNIDLSDYPDLSLQAKKELLSTLAYWMLRNSYAGEAPKEEVEQRLEITINELGLNISGHSVLKLFIERLGFLHTPAYQQIGYIHRSFQDYFSSREIIHYRDFRNLLSHIEDDNWRDVLILTAGQASYPDLATILNGILDKAQSIESTKQRRGMQLIALSCLERKPRITEDLVNRVLSSLEQLQYPQSREETFLFSNVGELAIPYLRNRKILSNTQKALCIDTLALIGSKNTLEEISGFSKEKNWEIVNSLGFASRFFNAVSYAEKILAVNIINSRKLVAPNLSLLSAIIQPIDISLLNELDIKSGTNLSILNTICELSNILSLYIYNNPLLEDISPVGSLKNLRSLDLRSNLKLKDISPLAKLNKLDYLDIRSNPSMNDISPLSNLTTLRVLDLRNCTQIGDFRVIGELKKLESLDLRENPQIRNVDFLENLPNLKTLYLRNNPLIEDLGVIATLPNLELLWVDKDVTLPSESKVNIFR